MLHTTNTAECIHHQQAGARLSKIARELADIEPRTEHSRHAAPTWLIDYQATASYHYRLARRSMPTK